MGRQLSDNLDLIFAALADSTRRKILTLLLERDLTVGEIAVQYSISLAAVSKHLGTLARAGLISRERKGRMTWCKLEPDALRDGLVWLDSLGQVESMNLDAFEKYLSTEFGEQFDE